MISIFINIKHHSFNRYYDGKVTFPFTPAKSPPAAIARMYTKMSYPLKSVILLGISNSSSVFNVSAHCRISAPPSAKPAETSNLIEYNDVNTPDQEAFNFNVVGFHVTVGLTLPMNQQISDYFFVSIFV